MKTTRLSLLLFYLYSCFAVGAGDLCAEGCVDQLYENRATIIEVLPVVELADAATETTLGKISRVLAAEEKQRQTLEKLGIALPMQPSSGYGKRGLYVKGKLVEAEIRRALKRSGYDNYRLVAPQRVYFRVLPKVKRREELEEVARAYLLQHLQQDYSDIHLRKVGQLKSHTLAESELRPRLVDQSIGRRMCIWVDELVNGVVQKSHPQWFEVSAYGTVYKLAKAVNKGDEFYIQDYVAEQVNVANLQGTPIKALASFSRHRYRDNLRPGQIMFKELLLKKPAVAYGEKIKVLSVVGNVQVQSVALAKAEGEIGEQVTLMSLTSQELFRGKVVANNEAIIGKGISSGK